MVIPPISEMPDDLERLVAYRAQRAAEEERRLLRGTAAGPDAPKEAKKFRSIAHMGDASLSNLPLPLPRR